MKPGLGMHVLSAFLVGGAAASAATVESCPGYKATNVVTDGSKLSADLVLAGTACNVYGTDVQKLKLEVQYETGMLFFSKLCGDERNERPSETRLHLKISDPAHDRYEVPESVFPRPKVTSGISPSKSAIKFTYTSSPFSFKVIRTKGNEVLFSTGKHPLVFEPQYLRLATDLPQNPNIYGLGEHTDTFRLPTDNFTRTMWSRDAGGVPNGTNLYGNHPVYFEHRTSGTHGVLLLSSNGMDIKINSNSSANSSTLEYNVLGGVLDLYFLAGSPTSPTAVATQYASLAGLPAEVPYWSFGFHQCRFGYNNFIDVADVISNYSAARIPLETMWTDIDYMQKRRVFTLDPDYFPLNRMREIVDYLHKHDQRYIVMVDPAVAYLPEDKTSAYQRGSEMDVWLKRPNGSDLLGVVWPGVTVYPDWFNPKTQR
jgi:alpha-glucosidase